MEKTTRDQEASTAVSDLRSLLEKALSEVGSTESIPPAITPPLFPPPSISDYRPPAPHLTRDQPSSSSFSVESAEAEEDWLVVRPRTERDGTRTTSKFLELGWKDRNIALNSTTPPGLVETDLTDNQPSSSTVPRRLSPQRASTEPPSTSNRPLPPLPPPLYLTTESTKSTQDGDDAYAFEASLFAGLDAKTNTDLSPPPPPPFRSLSSPPTTTVGTDLAASSASSSAPRDREEEGQRERSGTGRGAAKLRSLFFAGKLGGGKRKDESSLEYRRAAVGKSSGLESERQTHHASSLLPSSLSLNPFRHSSSPSSCSQRSIITPYTYGASFTTSTSAPDTESSPAVAVAEDDAFPDLPPVHPSTSPATSRLAGESSSGAYVTHGEISRRLEEMEDDESRRVGELWLV